MILTMSILQWVPSGEAFRISNLARLESETLPQYFRHSRFQSLVRQLNFYNFRKINRERTFWVYYHPLFHRDRPEEMYKLRRRTCPGFDGRRNRPNQGMSPPLHSASITWSNEDQVVHQHGHDHHHPGHDHHHAEEKEESSDATQAREGMLSPSGVAGVKVSRSPSPSNSPMNPLVVGRGSVHSSENLKSPALKSVVSGEENGFFSRQSSMTSSSSGYGKKSPYFRQTSLTSTSSEYNGHGHGIMEGGQKEFYHTDGSEEHLDMNEYYVPSQAAANPPPSDLFQAEEHAVIDQLSCHLDAPHNHQSLAATATTFTKKSRKAKQTYSIWSEDEDNNSSSNRSSFSSGRKKYSKEELQQRQAQLLAVAEVSRHLNGICADYAVSMMERKPSRGKGRGRPSAGGGTSAANNAPVIIPGHSIPVFGLDKPYDHYYGEGKCDLFTYDCDDGFVIDVDQNDSAAEEKRKKKDANDNNEKALLLTSSASSPRRESPEGTSATTPPSPCPLVNQSLVQACMEGKLVNTTSIFERTLASAILSFCLSTHPQDPYLAKKIAAHLKKGPMLAKEFDMYCEAMTPGVYADGGRNRCASEDLKRDWKMFSLNFIHRVVLAYRKRGQLTKAENEAIKRCVSSWSWHQEN
mmetsp:Transcript_33995/g.64713  ORF Transcript_33995/g.64713 Transcript_33995/m.64713 type:complete len:635 (-) Transcript_33995:418-2322(-)